VPKKKAGSTSSTSRKIQASARTAASEKSRVKQRKKKTKQVDAPAFEVGGRPIQRRRTPAQIAAAKDLFLRELRVTCHVGMAAAKAGVSRSVLFYWQKQDKEFADRWAEVYEFAVDDLEREAMRRGLEGIPKPIVYQGRVTGHYTEYSDRLLELLLKGRRGQVFAPRPDIMPLDTPEQLAARIRQALQRMDDTDQGNTDE